MPHLPPWLLPAARHATGPKGRAPPRVPVARGPRRFRGRTPAHNPPRSRRSDTASCRAPRNRTRGASARWRTRSGSGTGVRQDGSAAQGDVTPDTAREPGPSPARQIGRVPRRKGRQHDHHLRSPCHHHEGPRRPRPAAVAPVPLADGHQPRHRMESRRARSDPRRRGRLTHDRTEQRHAPRSTWRAPARLAHRGPPGSSGPPRRDHAGRSAALAAVRRTAGGGAVAWIRAGAGRSAVPDDEEHIASWEEQCRTGH